MYIVIKYMGIIHDAEKRFKRYLYLEHPFDKHERYFLLDV